MRSHTYKVSHPLAGFTFQGFSLKGEPSPPEDGMNGYQVMKIQNIFRDSSSKSRQHDICSWKTCGVATTCHDDGWTGRSIC